MKIIPQMEPWIGKEEEREVLKVLRSGWITEAAETRLFERKIADFLGVTYVNVVSNGTVSLTIAILAMGIGKGDEVIVPDFTMVATPNAVILAGATPVLVDIVRDTLCMDLNQVERAITKKTKAIIPVALNGRAPDMEKLMGLAKAHNLEVLEDAAQAFGCKWQGKYLGTFGEIGSFSFSTPKIITTGQGGALVTESKRYHERMIRLKDFGRLVRGSQSHDEIGYNFKFTDLQAAIGVAQMDKLSWRIERKKEMYRLYQQALAGVPEVSFLPTHLDDVSPWFIDVIVSEPKKLAAYLKEKGIETREFYPSIHTTKPYRGVGRFPNSLWATQHGLWLPSSSRLTDSAILRVCREIKAYYSRRT